QVEAMTLADKIVVLSGGAVQQVGTPNELYHAPANQFVAGFIGSPKMNFLKGTVESADAAGVLVRFDSGDTQRVAVDAAGLQRGASVTVGVRPEHLLVGAAGEGVVAKTMAVESLGDAAYLYAEAAVAPDGLIARIPPLDTYRTGEALRVHADAAHCHLFDEQGHAFRRLGVHAKAA
ncbi:ABC transporter-like protein, partial [Burkholderia sp. TJI49]